MNRPDVIVRYSEYIRNYLKENQPKDWNVGLLGEFPASSNMLQKYFKHILEQRTGRDKRTALEKHYKLNSKDSIDKKMFEIEGRTRSIYNFFENKTVPFEKNLNFIAFIFDVPICSLNEFIENNEIQEKILENNLTENDVAATKNSVNVETKQNTKVSKKTKSFRKPVFISLFFMSVISVFYIGFRYSMAQNNKNNKLAYSSVMPVYIGDTLFERIAVIEDSQQDTGLHFHTINIFNDKCLSKNSAWSFDTDPNGEDMNSKYGSPFNEEIKSLHSILNGRTTIANQMMEIHFNISNNTDKNLYFSNLKVSVLKTFDAEAEKAEYNLYQSRTAEEVFNIVLSDKNMYGFTVSKKEIKPNEAIFCRCKITGDDKCNGLIYKIKIVADFVDANGKHFQTKSDKNYLIGFL